ncbi:MAG: ethanolamine ammonia-lyase reactivating factor EutA [Anaerolineaceae bacterium]
MNLSRNMISVGIDIGTTTTQIIFSQLTLVDVARPGQVPRIDISNRKVLARSQIFFTPLIDAETIDVEEVARIITGEYGKAGIDPVDVETGAVIITGETARKKNADKILNTISDMAGDFVCTVAGPNVESMIAGKGSGAAEYSRKNFTTVTNIDIGGGSANNAVFKQGKMAASSAMNFGGRILILNPQSGKIEHITRPGQAILDYLELQLAVGNLPDLADLTRVTDMMADLTMELIEGKTSPLADKIYLTPPARISRVDGVIMFSGGVGFYYYDPIEIKSIQDAAIHGDIGPLLAQSLCKHPGIRNLDVVRPAETLRATVLGASSQTVTLSGSTIWAEESILPLKNLPVIHPETNSSFDNITAFSAAVQDAAARWDLDFLTQGFVLALDIHQTLDFVGLSKLSDALVQFSTQLPQNHPLIIVIQKDYAQALGQFVKEHIGRRPLLVIDQVGIEEGDYIDIGLPLMDGRVVPINVKTLVFYH